MGIYIMPGIFILRDSYVMVNFIPDDNRHWRHYGWCHRVR